MASVACNIMSYFIAKWKTSTAVSTTDGWLKSNFARCVIRYFRHAHWAVFPYIYEYLQGFSCPRALLLDCTQSTTIHVYIRERLKFADDMSLMCWEISKNRYTYGTSAIHIPGIHYVSDTWWLLVVGYPYLFGTCCWCCRCCCRCCCCCVGYVFHMPHPPTGISHAPTQHTRYTVSALARIASHLNVGGSLLSPLPASCVQYKMFSGTRSGLSPRTVYETYWYVVCSIMHQVPGTRYVVYYVRTWFVASSQTIIVGGPRYLVYITISV